jgi:HEAT repeat protein
MRASVLLTTALLLALALPAAAQRPADSRSKRKEVSSGESSSLVKMGGKTLDEWIGEMKSGDPSRRAAAVMAVPNFGKDSTRAVNALLDRVRGDRDVSPRVKAVIMLRFVHVTEKQVPAVVKALAARIGGAYPPEHQAVVRYEAAITLGRWADKAQPAIKALAQGTQDAGSWEIRHACAHVLWQAAYDKEKGPDPAAVRALVGILSRDPTVQVRLEAIRGLGALGRPRDPKLYALVQQALQTQATTGSATARVSSKVLAIWAATVLQVLEHKSAETDTWLKRVAKFLQARELQVRIQAASALGALGKKSRRFVPALAALLKDKEAEAVQAGCLALAQVGEPRERVLDALKGVLGHKDPNVVVTACQALIQLRANGADVFHAIDQQLERKEVDDRLKHVLKETIKVLKAPPPKPAALAPQP